MNPNGQTPIPFTGTVKSIGNIARIKNDNGTLVFSLEKTHIYSALNSGNNINFSSGTIGTSSNPTFNSVKIDGNPQNDTDAATVGYVKQFVQGIRVKEPVKYATTENIPLTGQIEVDGKPVENGDRILVKDQDVEQENGIYIANTSGFWQRAADFNEPNEVKGAFVFVAEGTVNSAKGFVQTNNSVATVGTDAINFTQFNGNYVVEAGEGLTKSGNTLSVEASVLSDIVANTAKVGITTEQADAILANTAKVGITTEQAAAIAIILNLPTSNTSLTAGAIWNDNGVLKVVQQAV